MTTIASLLFSKGRIDALETMSQIVSSAHRTEFWQGPAEDRSSALSSVERRRQQKRDYMRRVRARAKQVGVKEWRYRRYNAAGPHGFCATVRAAADHQESMDLRAFAPSGL